MHRVELKADIHPEANAKQDVPNAPCGVESLIFSQARLLSALFLMHRVELKVGMEKLKDFLPLSS